MGIFTITQEPGSINLYVYPNNDLSGCTELTPNGDSPNYKCIDELWYVPDADATYVSWDNTAPGIDLYSLPSDTTLSGTINYIQIYARAKSHLFAQSINGVFKILCSPNSTCTEIFKSADNNLTTSYKTYNYVLVTNPSTATEWTINDIQNLSIGIEVSSPLVNDAQLQVVRTLSANGYLTEWNTLGCHYGYTNYQCIRNDCPTCYLTSVDTAIDSYELAGDVDTGVIDSVTIFYRARQGWYSPKGGLAFTQSFFRLNNTNYYEISFPVIRGTATELYAYSELKNPDTNAEWDWSDFNDMEVGFRYDSHDEGTVYFTSMYVVVDYHKTFHPEIHTTQCYLKVNYTPTPDICTLNKPEEISVDHSRNVKMLNFWDGTREVYDLSRSGKSMVLTGKEYQSSTCAKTCPCEHITCMRSMGKEGSTITLSGLSFNLFNGDYKIRSFGWKHVSEKPEVYEWILELEEES